MMIESQQSWMTLILEYIQNGIDPKDQKEMRKLQRGAAKFYIIDDKIYIKGFTQPLLKCLRMAEAEYVKVEIYEGCCGQ